MANTMFGAVLAVATLALASASVVKFDIPHSVMLDKFHPIVKEFSNTMAGALDKSNQGLQIVVYDAITKTLALQMDDLVANNTAAANGGINMCCQCKTCTRKCRACGQSCCCSGSGGCRCKSCSSDSQEALLTLESFDMGTSPIALDSWAASTKDSLTQQLRPVVSAHVPSSNAKCCACTHCKQYVVGTCGLPVCCTSGKLCVCRTCEQTGLVQMSSVEDFVSLTPEAEQEVEKVSTLVDQLVAVITVS